MVTKVCWQIDTNCGGGGGSGAGGGASGGAGGGAGVGAGGGGCGVPAEMCDDKVVVPWFYK